MESTRISDNITTWETFWKLAFSKGASSLVHGRQLPKLRLLCPIPSYEPTFCFSFPQLTPTGKPAGRKWYCLLSPAYWSKHHTSPFLSHSLHPLLLTLAALSRFHPFIRRHSVRRSWYTFTSWASEEGGRSESARRKERERDFCFRYSIGCVTVERCSSLWLALCLEGSPWRKGTLRTPWRAWTINWGQRVRPPVATCSMCEGCSFFYFIYFIFYKLLD